MRDNLRDSPDVSLTDKTVVLQEFNKRLKGTKNDKIVITFYQSTVWVVMSC